MEHHPIWYPGSSCPDYRRPSRVHQPDAQGRLLLDDPIAPWPPTVSGSLVGVTGMFNVLGTINPITDIASRSCCRRLLLVDGPERASPPGRRPRPRRRFPGLSGHKMLDQPAFMSCGPAAPFSRPCPSWRRRHDQDRRFACQRAGRATPQVRGRYSQHAHAIGLGAPSTI